MAVGSHNRCAGGRESGQTAVMTPILWQIPLGLFVIVGVYFLPHIWRLLEQRRLRRVCKRSKSIVLSYDDGPGSHLTPVLLDLLSRHGVKATFFLLGNRVTQSPELVERIVREGHELGSHGFHHVNAWKSPPWRVASDIKKGFASLARWREKVTLFRPPYGKVTMASALAMKRSKAKLGLWTIPAGDTYRQVPETKDILDKLQSERGGVLLMHDFHAKGPRGDFVLFLTEAVIDLAKREGLSIRRLGELVPCGS